MRTDAGAPMTQRERESRCDAVLDQILDWPVIAWSEIGGRLGRHRTSEGSPAVLWPVRHKDPRFGNGRRWGRVYTPIEIGCWKTGIRP